MPLAARQQLRRGLSVEPNRGDFNDLLARCHLSVSQAGYNTMIDLLHARVRALVVPYAMAGQREQGIRARRLAELGLLHVLDADQLNPVRLQRAMLRAAAARRPARLPVRLDGAENAAEAIMAIGAGS